MRDLDKITKLEDLFKAWRQVDSEFEVFCKDGAPNEEKYKSHRILFALKDVHLEGKAKEECLEAGIFDMREHVCDKEDWRTWNPIALWAKALIDEDGLPYDQILDRVSDKMALRREYLHKIAFMNLKKESGGASVSSDCVACYAKKHSKMIFHQIRILDPKIIIACSYDVFDALHEFVFPMCKIESKEINLNAKMAQYGQVFDIAPLYGKNAPLYVVNYRHPVDYGRGSCTAAEHYSNMLEIRKLISNN